MKIKHGKDVSGYGPGVVIKLTSEEVAIAIDAYLVAHNVNIRGPRTIRVNGELIEKGQIYVDPSGKVYADGKEYSGRGR